MPILNIPIDVPTTSGYDLDALKQELVSTARRFFAAAIEHKSTKETTAEEDCFAAFSGDWGWDGKDTHELVADLRAARVARRATAK